jgi:signal peptidase I
MDKEHMNDENTDNEHNAHEQKERADTDAPKKNSVLAEILSWVKPLAIAVVAALIVRTFIFTPAIVKGTSMDDTLQTGQVMAVVKASYLVGSPQRGQVVFCRYPGWQEDCVKRVIGLPGERVSIIDSVVYIDGVPLDEPYLSRPQTGDYPEIVVPEGQYFVMGDNRGVSLDSRSIGPLNESQIEGHCMAVFWPLSEIKAIH